MDQGRFSLLLLDPGEIYFEDFSAVLIPPDVTPKSFDCKKQDGRLKMCSKSLVFDPKDITKALIKILLKDCVVIEQWKGEAKYLVHNNVITVKCRGYVEMLEGNVVAPYKFKEATIFRFQLNYANITNCLHQIGQLRRASSLPTAEQSDMIATIVHSRQARVKFDPLWLDLYETIVMETEADKITPLVVNPGRVVLSTSRLFFQPYNNVESVPVIIIDLKCIKRMVKRRFLLRHIGLEIFSSDSTKNPHIYLSFKNQLKRENFYEKLFQQPILKLEDVDQNVMTLQWQNGIISNYDYVLYINSLGDRTMNDLTQYPVFPWIISNYTSQEPDLQDPKNFRDLSKPVGALDDVRLQRLVQRYEEMHESKFLYGSHYSTPGFVLFYLARLYPHYVLCLQSGRFDHPDRMFNSVADVYKNCLTNMSDFKELIPEFYDITTDGNFLINSMGINFGHRYNGIKVDNVELPLWAESPKDYILKNRKALESNIVSQSLHNWIDLIFGYKQKGSEAIKCNNLFYHLCYEGNVDLDSITDLNERHALEVQIMEFGQIPKQVFNVPHPPRKNGLPLFTKPSQTNSTEIEDIWNAMNKLEVLNCFNTHKNSVSHLFISDDGTTITSVGHDSKIKVFSLPESRQTRSANICGAPLSCCLQIPKINVLAVGSWDNQIFFYDLDYGKISDSVLAHEDVITCLCWSRKTNFLVSGSNDCTVKIWKGLNTNGKIKPIQCLEKQLDHGSHVTCLDLNTENANLAVGTNDGEIYIWCTEDFSLVTKYQLCSSAVVSINFSPDGIKLALGLKNNTLQIIDVGTGLSVFYQNMSSSISSLKWRSFLLILGCENGSLFLWNILEVKLLCKVEAAHTGALTTVDILPDKFIIVTGADDGLIKVWKLVNSNGM